MKNKYVDRLFLEWKQHGKIIIAVDFDDTISPWKFNDNDYMDTINLIIEAKTVGAYVVIFTACNPDRYDEIKNYCETKGLIIDAINNNPINLPYGVNGKIYANIFLDDRAGLDEAKSILSDAMYKIKGDLNISSTIKQQF